VGDVAPGDGAGRGAESLREPQIVGDAIAFDNGQPRRSRSLDIDCCPWDLQTMRNPPGIADQPPGVGRFADADEHPLSGRPGARDRMLAHVREQLLIDPLSRPAQCELAQGSEVPLGKVVPDRALCLVWHIDLTLTKTLD